MGALNITIQGIIDKLYDDTLVPGLELTVDVVFRRFARSTYDPDDIASGLGSAIVQNVKGLLRPITRVEVNSSDGLLHSSDSVLFVKYDPVLFPTIDQRQLGLDNEIQLSVADESFSPTENYVIVSSEQSAVGEQKISIKLFIRRVRF